MAPGLQALPEHRSEFFGGDCVVTMHQGISHSGPLGQFYGQFLRDPSSRDETEETAVVIRGRRAGYGLTHLGIDRSGRLHDQPVPPGRGELGPAG